MQGMVNKYIFLIIVFILGNTNLILSQYNLDSLSEIAEKIKIKEVSKPDYWGNIMTKYYDDDSLLHFIITRNNGKIVNGDMGHGVAIHYYIYDEKKRIQQRLTLGDDGNYKMGESPPIIKYYYDKNGRELRRDYFTDKDIPQEGLARVETKYNKNGNETLVKKYNENYELEGDRCIFKTKYKKKGRIIIKSSYGSNKKIWTWNGVAFFYEKYESDDRIYIAESRFYDEKKKPIEGLDIKTGIKYYKAKYDYDTGRTTRTKTLYNLNDEEIYKGLEDVNE